MEYLQTQKVGLTGHPEALSYPYTTNLWDGEIPRMGKHGRDWWRYEQTAYYTDGLIRLGYLINDEAMIEKAKKFAFHLRIPTWCEGATLTVNGKKVEEVLTAGSFYTLNRKFANGDQIVLDLPMKVVRKTAHGGGVWFERGPLVYTYAIPEKWEKDTIRYANMNGKYPADDNAFPCWSITPAGDWNYAVAADAEAKFVMTKNGPRLRVKAYPIDWELAKGPKGELLTPDLPVAPNANGAGKYIELKPYGQTQLRLTVFPVLYKK